MAPYNPPSHAHYTELDVSMYDEDFIWFVIGVGGKNFYDITSWLKLQYLWFDSVRGVVEIWGSWSSLSKLRARERLCGVIEQYHSIYVKPTHGGTCQSQSDLSAGHQQTEQNATPSTA